MVLIRILAVNRQNAINNRICIKKIKLIYQPWDSIF